VKRGWLLLLILSLSLNLGLLAAVVAVRSGVTPPWERPFDPDAPPPQDEPRPGRMGAGPPHADWDSLAQQRHEELAARLGLDPQQRADLLRIHRGVLSGMGGLRDDVRRARHAVRAAYLADPPDTAAIRSGLRALAVAQGRVDSLVSAGLLRELALLTPAQREAYLARMPWEPGHGPGGPDRPRGERRRR